MEMRTQVTESSPAVVSQSFFLEIWTRRVWVMECPRCKGSIEKEQPADFWKCPRCGWE